MVLEGAEGFAIDIRSEVADATTSFAASPITGAADGKKISLLVADDERGGAEAYLVVVDQHGEPIFKQHIIIGEN